MRTIKCVKKLTAAAAALLFVLLAPCALAAEPSKMTLEMPGEEQRTGDIVTARVYIYHAEFNVAGFSLSYDTSIMEPVNDRGVTTENGAQAVRLSGLYDQVNETGTFVPLEQSLNTDTGRMSATFYVSPSVGTSVTADSGGMLVAEISFKMLTDGQPSAEFATDSDSVDYNIVPCRILHNGLQMETAEATVIRGEEHTQTVDISQSVITAAEQQNLSEESQDLENVDNSEDPEDGGKNSDTQGTETTTKNSADNNGSGEDGPDAAVEDSNNRIFIMIAIVCAAAAIGIVVAVRTVHKKKKMN